MTIILKLTKGDLIAAIADYVRKVHPDLLKTYDNGITTDLREDTEVAVTLSIRPARDYRD